MNKKTMAILIVVLAGLLVWAAGSSGSGSLAQGGGEVGPQAVLTPLLQYQGRLTDPGTGEAVADGEYTMTFSLYDVASGGSALWTEEKIVPVQGGLFSTALGDTTALDQDLFNGQALWLGVKVRADAEATPRQQVLPVAYALGLVPGAVVEASSTDPMLKVVQSGNGYGLWGETSGGTAAVLGYNTGSGYGVWGYSNNGYGGYFSSGGVTALYASGDAEVTGDLNVGGSLIGADDTTLPIAYGVVLADGGLASGSPNVGSTWNASNSWYEITISGYSYFWDDYVTVVTLFSGCDRACTVRTSSVGGNLLIIIYDGTGSEVQCAFQFVTHKP